MCAPGCVAKSQLKAAMAMRAEAKRMTVSRGRENGGFDFSLSHRLTERGEQRSATAFGTVGDVAISIERALPAGGSAFLSLSRARSSP